MIILANFLLALGKVINLGLTIYAILIVIRAVASWIIPAPYGSFLQFVYLVTEPVLKPVRRVLPRLGGVDISPIIVLLVIFFVNVFISNTLVDYAVGMK